MIPASAYAAHSSGAACPFDKTNRSFAGFRGSFGSKRISLKKITDMRSAADRQDDGCPEPASVVALSEWMRRRLPFSLRVSIDMGICFNFIPADKNAGRLRKEHPLFGPRSMHFRIALFPCERSPFVPETGCQLPALLAGHSGRSLPAAMSSQPPE